MSEPASQRTYHIVTLGCDKNTVDSEAIADQLEDQGFAAAAPDQASVIVVNTCGFIAAARAESVEALREATRQKRPGQVVIAAGCMAQKFPGVLRRKVRGLDGLVGAAHLDQVAELAARLCSERRVQRRGASTGNGQRLYPHLSPSLPVLVDGALEAPLPGMRRRQTGASAYLKISEGCDAPCTFCAIPTMRGRFRSKPPASVVEEARQLQERGVQEIVLVAQDTTFYGRDLKPVIDLAGLLRLIAAAAPRVPWIRVMYAYPAHVTPSLIDAMAELEQVVPYLDVPLQHAHPEVLARMRRPRVPGRTQRLLADLRQAVPGIALRTTFIVGFPGETEAEFVALLAFLDEIQFDHAGAFIYSPEPGTPAADMPGQVPLPVKQERFQRLMERQRQVSLRRNRALVAQTLDVLVEGVGELESDGASPEPLLVGRASRHAPEVDGLVLVQGRGEPGRFIRAKITGATEYDLWGTLAAVTAGSR